MKAYNFSLNKVRNYKSQVLDREKKKLAVLQKKRDEIAEKIIAIESFRDEKNAELVQKQYAGAMVSELASYSYLIENARLQLKALFLELNKAEKEMEVQRQVVISVYQEKTGMDKLEEKQVEEYRLLEAKDFQDEILQIISNKISVKKTAS